MRKNFLYWPYYCPTFHSSNSETGKEHQKWDAEDMLLNQHFDLSDLPFSLIFLHLYCKKEDLNWFKLVLVYIFLSSYYIFQTLGISPVTCFYMFTFQLFSSTNLLRMKFYFCNYSILKCIMAKLIYEVKN